MESEGIFRMGGLLFVLSGAIGLFYWIVSFMDGFENSLLPGISAFITTTTGIGVLQNLLITLGAVTLSIGLILSGLVFVRIPTFTKKQGHEELEQKLNRVQTVVWKVLQHMKNR